MRPDSIAFWTAFSVHARDASRTPADLPPPWELFSGNSKLRPCYPARNRSDVCNRCHGPPRPPSKTAAACYAERHTEARDLLKRHRLPSGRPPADAKHRNPPTGEFAGDLGPPSRKNSPTSSPALATAARLTRKDWTTNHAKRQRTHRIDLHRQGQRARWPKVRITRETPSAADGTAQTWPTGREIRIRTARPASARRFLPRRKSAPTRPRRIVDEIEF